MARVGTRMFRVGTGQNDPTGEELFTSRAPRYPGLWYPSTVKKVSSAKIKLTLALIKGDLKLMRRDRRVTVIKMARGDNNDIIVIMP